ncbi:MAG: methylenetetrahydrofolate reductase, partial [Armatimonadota bacterium]
VGIEVMMHFSCRDRNLLAIQADLLGAHALGLRNILAITGDPTQVGDYPTATSVFDIDSIGLVRILSRFNEGIDLAGNSIVEPTAFLIAVAFNPTAPDFVYEVERLRRKVGEGAQLVYTQPIYEIAVLEKAVAETQKLGVPMLVGILPLRSYRHAEFFHNEVPGIYIPEEIRQRMASMSDQDARALGMDLARDLLAQAQHITAGAYLMPPFGNYRIAQELMQVLDTSRRPDNLQT